MEALKVKYEQNRGEILKHLDVSPDLLDVMTRHGLIDIADRVKYQGIHDMKKRNGSLMKTMVERRTERAYPLFIQSLRQAGQDSVANLLTDIGEETRILTQLQSQLEQEVGAIADYIRQEERRTGVAAAASGGNTGTPEGHPQNDSCDRRHHDDPPLPHTAVPTSDREVWVGVQSTLKRATAQFERCRTVIDKLHQDCQDLATANGDMVVQIRNCYSRVKRMLKPGLDSGQTEVPKSTQAMFQNLIDDVETLMNRKSKAQQLENEGRSTAMRMLRHLRDWIQERSSILDTLQSATHNPSPRATRLPLLSSRRPSAFSAPRDGGYNTTAITTPPLHPRYTSSRQHTPSPTRSQTNSEEGIGSSPQMTYLPGYSTEDQGQNQSQGYDTGNDQRHDKGQSYETGQGQGYDQGHGHGHNNGQGYDKGQSHEKGQDQAEDGEVGVVRAEYLGRMEPHAISTVLEGLHLLEQQVRRYVQMEIWLTDKFRAEMRYRHLKKKSFGYTPRGLHEASRALERLESGATQLNSSVTSHSSFNGPRTSLGAGRGGGGAGGAGGGADSRLYLTKLRASFDAMCEEYSACVNYMSRISTSLVKIPDVDDFLAHINDDDNDPNDRHNKKNKDRKNRQQVDDKPSFFSIFSRKKPDTKPAPSRDPLHLPTITTNNGRQEREGVSSSSSEEESLVQQLKLLVANFEMVKHKLQRLEDRYRREYDHRRRAFDASLRAKDEEVRRLTLRLKEVEAEKDKFRSLYDKMKIAFSKKR